MKVKIKRPYQKNGEIWVDTMYKLYNFQLPFKNIIIIGILLWLVPLGGCKEGERTPNSNMVELSLLEPNLLLDTEEIEEYLRLFPHEKYEIFDVQNLGSFYLDDNPASVKKTLKSGKPWEPDVQQIISRYTVTGSTALDVGAHIGSHTLTLSKAVGPKGVVYAFEPQKKIYRELVKNLELNRIRNVVPLRYCVGSTHDVIEMNPQDIRDGRTRVGKGGDKAELRTIDSFSFSNVSLIKIDVEGYQIPVLLGAEKTIRTWHPVIIIEILGGNRYEQLLPKFQKDCDKTKEILEQLGYELTLISCLGECDYLALYKGEKS